MNKLISKAFGFVVESLSVVLLVLNLIFHSIWFFWVDSFGLKMLVIGSSLFGMVLLVLLFGVCSIFIENHRILKNIDDKLSLKK